MMAASGPSLLDQYADLREEDDDDIVAAEPSLPDRDPSPVEAETLLPDRDTSFTSVEDMVEGSWFIPNASAKKNGKRHREKDPATFGSLPELSKRARGSLAAFPASKTLLSQGSLRTILLSQPPDDCGKFLGSSTRRLSSDPISVAKGLKAILDYSQVKDVRINPRRNVVAVEFNTVAASEACSLLGLTHLAQYAVVSYRPSTDHKSLSWGVLHDVGLDVDVAELKASIVCDTSSVLSVVRLNKFTGGVRQLSTSVKVGFSSATLPSLVRIDFVQIRVRPFVEPPLRCYRCQRPGHLASGCTAKIRCLVCAGNHLKDECTADTPKCANCAGVHIASSRECPYVRDGKQIQKLVKAGLPFREARRQVVAASRTVRPAGPSVPDFPGCVSHSSGSLAVSSPNASQGLSSGPQLRNIVVPVDVHNTQGSYYIPRRYPRQPLNFAEALTQSQPHVPPATQLSQCITPCDTPACSPPPVPPSAPHVSQQVPPCDTPACSPPPVPLPAVAVEEQVFRRCRDHLDTLIETLFVKLSKFLIEAFSLNLSSENNRERELLLLGMVRNHFSRETGESLLNDFQGFPPSSPVQKPPPRSSGRNKRPPSSTSSATCPTATSGGESSAVSSGGGSSAATSGRGSSAATSGRGPSAATSGRRSSAATSGRKSSAATSRTRIPVRNL